MTIKLFDCNACVSCSPCPGGFALDAWQYDRRECVSNIQTLVETRYSFAIPWVTGATDVGVVSASVKRELVSGGPASDGVLVTPLTMPKYRPASGEDCALMLGVSYTANDPRVYIVTKLVIGLREQDLSITYIDMYIDSASASICKTCTTNLGVTRSAYVQSALTGFFLTESKTGTCATPDERPVEPRKTDVSLFMGTLDPCCPGVVRTCIFALRDVGGSGPNARNDIGWLTWSEVFNPPYCSTVSSTPAPYSRALVSDGGACAASPIPGDYTVSGTISGSTIGGSASVSVTLVNTCSGLTVQSAHGTAVAAGPSTTMPPVSETLVVTTVIDTGHPCYVYELELTVSGYNGGNSAYYGNCSVFPGGATSGSAIVNGAITLYVKAR